MKREKMGPQDELQLALDRTIDLAIRRDLFWKAMTKLASSEKHALELILILCKGVDPMEFLAHDPYGDLICCDWLQRLQRLHHFPNS